MTDFSTTAPKTGGYNADGDLKQQAKDLGSDLKNKASDFTETVTRTAQDQAAQFSSAAKEFASDAAGKLGSAVNEQKGAGADYLSNIARAINRAAGEFEGDIPQAAHYIRQAASQVDNVATAVRDRNVNDLLSEVQQFARRQPTAFFSGAVILGFAAIRFFKSSTASGSSSQQNAPYRNPGQMNLHNQPPLYPSEAAESYARTKF